MWLQNRNLKPPCITRPGGMCLELQALTRPFASWVRMLTSATFFKSHNLFLVDRCYYVYLIDEENEAEGSMGDLYTNVSQKQV